MAALRLTDERELGRLLDRQIGRLGALEDFVHVNRGAPVHVLVARPIRHQAAGLDQFAVRIDIWQALLGGEIHHAFAVMQEYAVGQDEERLRLLFEDRGECAVEVFRCAHVRGCSLIPKPGPRRAPARMDDSMKRIGRIEEKGDVREVGNDLPEQLQPFAFEVRRDRAQSGDIAAGPRQARHDAGADRIADRDHDHRDRRRRLLDGEGGGRARGHDHIHFRGEQFGDERGKALVFSFRPAILDDDVAALLVAELAQPVAERPDEIGLERSGGVAQENRSRGIFPLLRAGRRAAMQPPRRREA